MGRISPERNQSRENNRILRTTAPCPPPATGDRVERQREAASTVTSTGRREERANATALLENILWVRVLHDVSLNVAGSVGAAHGGAGEPGSGSNHGFGGGRGSPLLLPGSALNGVQDLPWASMQRLLRQHCSLCKKPYQGILFMWNCYCL